MKLNLDAYVSAAKEQLREEIEKELEKHVERIVSEQLGKIMAIIELATQSYSDGRVGFVVQFKENNG